MTEQNSILSGLNAKQREAVEVLEGPLLILAGAGSGKTKCLTHRIANLIAHGAKPSQILAVTFTNKAASEMKGRVEKLLGGGRSPMMGTFHSICVRILREDIEQLACSISRSFVIFDTDDSQKLIKMIMKELGFDPKEIKHKAIKSHISAAKNQLMSPEAYQVDAEDNRFTRAVKQIFPAYQRKLAEHNALDFDDLLQKTVQLFDQCEEVLKKYRKRWHHLLVDEYQDTNIAQYKLVRQLSDEHQNLCVIGDDHQSIYSFRGADYTNILNFENDFPNAAVIKLEQNYRSTGNILNNANHLIGFNETGREKNLWTENEAGDPLSIVEVWNEKEEGQHIATQIRDLVREGALGYNDCAILYRMNAQSRAIEEAFLRSQIPYQIVGGTRFFDRREIKDVIAYLRLIFNPKDDLAFLRIINLPTRKIGPSTIEKVKEYANHYTLSLFEILEHIDEVESLPEAKRCVLKNFRDLIKDLQEIAQKEPVSIVLDRVVDKIKLYEFLNDGTAEGESRIQNVKELFSVAMRYDTAEQPLAAFLEGVALISDLDQHNDKSDTVTLMTIHAAKGLEFPMVFLPGWEDGMFPSSNAQFSPENLEEERRLGYVAITRAKTKCMILHAQQRMMFGKTDYSSPSKFLSELDEECLERTGDSREDTLRKNTFSYRQPKAITSTSASSRPQAPEQIRDPFTPRSKREATFGLAENTSDYKIGDRVAHMQWGEGTIIMIAGDVLSVAFSGQGVKKIVASVAPIQKI